MILTLFESVQKAYTRPNQIIDNTWDEIAKFLMTHQPAKTKDDVPLFNLWEFDMNGEPGRKRIYENNEPTEKYEEIPGTIRRCKANGKFIHGLVLDFDGHQTIEDAMANYADFESVLYTTFRHTKDTHKFRLVLPFKHAIASESFHKKKKAISETFQGVDHASFSESQSFYLHSGPEPVVIYTPGEFLNGEWFEDEVITPPPEIKRSSEFNGDSNIYKELLIDSLATCSGLHYNGTSKYNVLTLVALCKSAGLSYQDYDVLCHNMADPSSSLQNAALRKQAWVNWSPYSGITSAVREDFILSHNGISKFPVRLPDKQFMTSSELKDYVRKKYMRRTDE